MTKCYWSFALVTNTTYHLLWGNFSPDASAFSCLQTSPVWNWLNVYRPCVRSNEPDMTKPTKWLCAQQRLRSAWASAESDQSLHCPHEETLGPKLPVEHTARTLIRLGRCPGWSESLLGAHSFCWFCHVAAQMTNELEYDKTNKLTYAPSKDSDQPSGQSPSLMRVLAVRMKKP